MKDNKSINDYEEDFKIFKLILNNITNIVKKLDYGTYNSINKSRLLFDEKTENFLQVDRKLNIGVIGQVKTGRSTFLNTLLFEGEKILPKAVTPKTATLTKILYSDTNYIEIEFLSVNDWNQLKETSSFHEIQKIISKANLNVEDFLSKENKYIYVDSPNDLEKSLNDYIGNDGKYSPVIKSITLHIKRKGIRNIEIVDTPGLNDPILSRTQKTKDFLEICDVVFFLSHSSQFLDNTDINLLTKVLPDKGVKRLVLVGSRFDDGLNDTLEDYKDLQTAIKKTTETLTESSTNIFNALIENSNNKELNRIYSSMKVPIFISSMTHNMSKKNLENYSENENIVFKNLSYHGDVNNNILKQIGNFEKIERTFKNIGKQKEAMLLRKAKSFIPNSKANVKNILENGIYKINKRMDLLNNYDSISLENQKNYMISQGKFLKESLDSEFKIIFHELEDRKENTLKDFNKNYKNHYTIEETIYTQTITEVPTRPKVKWYKPSTWKEKPLDKIQFEEEYTYINVDDALDKIKKSVKTYEKSAIESIDMFFNVEDVREKLLTTILETHDTSNIDFDPIFYKIIVKNTIDSLEMPKAVMNIDFILNIISNKFQGQVKNTSDKESLKILFDYCINIFHEKANETFENAVKTFQNQLDNIVEDFYFILYENINEEYNLLISQSNNKEKQLKDYKNILLLLNSSLDLLG